MSARFSAKAAAGRRWAGRAVRWVWLRARGLVVRLDPRLRRRDIRHAAPERFVRAAYQVMLRRSGDPAGVDNYVTHLERGTLTADGVLDEMLTSMELRRIRYRNPLRSLHLSRCDFVRLFPRARRILDLGGTDQDDPVGSLVGMGYPYPFEELVIVDLPHEHRHDLYARSARLDEVPSPLGPVRYRYHSMVDLSQYESASFDLVVSGQSIEHVSEAEADEMLAGVRRVLVPGGWFCLDTPNRRATALQCGERFSNPDHEVEYTDAELRSKLGVAGFEVVGAYGLSFVGGALAKDEWSDEELAGQHGVYAEIDDCYALAYVCRSPGSG